MAIDWDDNKKRKEFRKALQDAYPSLEALKLFVDKELNVNLATVADESNLQVTSYALIKWARATNRLDEVYQAFKQQNPKHPVIWELERKAPIPHAFHMTAPLTAKPEPIIKYRDRTAQFFPENALDLAGGQTPLDMVYIPPGSFLMGSPEDELGRYADESQHLVTIAQPFFMGKYPITQAQWRVVAAMRQVEHQLDPDPSRFKGNNRPVEQISWHDAVEFCRRLDKATGRPYRLPSEAEWEYACRAETTTPFHFGESITTDLANYRGTDWEYEGKTYSGAYGDGPHGEFREETTDVGCFEVANAFGLYDMHGNVWEWCQDWWHESYEGAPVDGSAWLSHEADAEEKRVLRGGSWDNVPGNCRSAGRSWSAPVFRADDVGLRVVCGIART